MLLHIFNKHFLECIFIAWAFILAGIIYWWVIPIGKQNRRRDPHHYDEWNDDEYRDLKEKIRKQKNNSNGPNKVI